MGAQCAGLHHHQPGAFAERRLQRGFHLHRRTPRLQPDGRIVGEAVAGARDVNIPLHVDRAVLARIVAPYPGHGEARVLPCERQFHHEAHAEAVDIVHQLGDPYRRRIIGPRQEPAPVRGSVRPGLVESIGRASSDTSGPCRIEPPDSVRAGTPRPSLPAWRECAPDPRRKPSSFAGGRGTQVHVCRQYLRKAIDPGNHETRSP